jgi:hypothetical protein
MTETRHKEDTIHPCCGKHFCSCTLEEIFTEFRRCERRERKTTRERDTWKELAQNAEKRLSETVRELEATRKLVNIWRAAATEPPDIGELVDRFLCWTLPKDFGPDGGIAFRAPTHPNSWPVGTNLFTAAQARAMFEHLFNIPSGEPREDDKPDKAPPASKLEHEFHDNAGADREYAELLREALTDLRREAVVLGREYLETFRTWKDDATIQGWDKARWVRALAAAEKADAALAKTENQMNCAPKTEGRGTCTVCGLPREECEAKYAADNAPRVAEGESEMVNVPTGWRLVPVEPTAVQTNAGADADDLRTGFEAVKHIYRAMVEMSPWPPQTPPEIGAFVAPPGSRQELADSLAHALSVALPMVKGYAAEHRVGRNEEIALWVADRLQDWIDAGYTSKTAHGVGNDQRDWALRQGDALADWCNRSAKALKAMMGAYERRIRSLCDPAQIVAEPWRCAEFIEAERALADKPVAVVEVSEAPSQ